MVLLCGWLGRIIQRLLSDYEGCASKLCVFPIEKYGAKGKALFEVKLKNPALSPSFNSNSSTHCEESFSQFHRHRDKITDRAVLNIRHT